MNLSRKAAPLLGLATLAALGLAAGPPAHAGSTGLTVAAGDNVQVDRNGTTYFSGGGSNNAITSYSGTQFGVLVASSASNTVFTLGDGGYVYGGAYGGNDRGSYSADVLNINGGTIAGGTYGISVANGAIANITRGTVQGSTYAAEVGTGSILNVSGGSFQPPSPLGGLDNWGTTNFFGTNFEYSTDGGNNFSTVPTTLTNSDVNGNSNKNILKGTLLNGDPLDLNFAIAGGQINFNLGVAPTEEDTLTPEPASWAAFAFMGLFAAGLMIKARRRVSSSAA